MVKPLDPRLLRRARSARRYVVLTAGLGMLSAALVVGQALLVAHLLGALVQHGGVTGPTAARTLGGLAAVAGGRAVVGWAQERYAQRAAARTVAELRAQVVEHAVALGPRWAAGSRRAEVATLATRGLDALEPYLVRYLPSLLLTALVTPAVLLVMLGLDWVSLVICVVTLPLVPLFMWLVGVMTAGTSERRLVVVQRLGAQVLDLLAGLPTLRAFGRESGPGVRVRALGDASRRATMGTLRVAFLSGMVLELLTTLSVAIVAVGVGLRLVDGAMTLEVGLAVIMLAPEVYLPLRQVGAQFHASTDGLAAAEAAFEVLETEVDESEGPAPSPAGVVRAIVLDDVSVRAGNRGVLAPAGLSARIAVGPGADGRGSVVVLRGVSGAGKSTTVEVMLGLLRPDAGAVFLEVSEAGDAGPSPASDPRGGGVGMPRPRVSEMGDAGASPASDTRGRSVHLSDAGDAGASPASDTPRMRRVPLDDAALAWWWGQLVWVPQRPAIAPGRLRDVVGGGVSDDELTAAARTTGLDAVVASLPDGWDTPVGLGGVGLSVGQRQRVALTAALLGSADRPVVVLDEPTAHLDAEGERVVLDTVRAWRDAGRTVVVIAHRASLLAIADQVVDVETEALAGVGA